MYKQGYKKIGILVLTVGRWVNKLILPFKQNQVGRYERCDQHVSIYCFRLEKFDSVFSQFLVYLILSADCR